MSDYKNILLVARPVRRRGQIIGERAKAIAACYQSQITLLHVVEYVPVDAMRARADCYRRCRIEGELVEDAPRCGSLNWRSGPSLSNSRQVVETGGMARPRSSGRTASSQRL